MSDLQTILDLIKSEVITADQTFLIDKVLSEANSEDIPSSLTLSVINYIDLQLAHNAVDKGVKDHLGHLYNELQQRQDQK